MIALFQDMVTLLQTTNLALTRIVTLPEDQAKKNSIPPPVV